MPHTVILHRKLLHSNTQAQNMFVCFGPVMYYICSILEIASRSASGCSGVLSSQVCRPAAAWLLLLLERKCRIKLSVQQIFGENAISSAAGRPRLAAGWRGEPGPGLSLDLQSGVCAVLQCCSVTPPVLQLEWLPRCCKNSVCKARG